MTGPRRLICVLAMTLAAAGASAQVAEVRYVIEPNDVLSIRYLATPEYDHTATVQPDGYVSAPVVGELKVAGLTLPQAREAIVAAAGRRLRDPEVYVDLKEFDKPRFTVAGEVGTPGRFALNGRTTVLEAIATAGGLKTSSKHSQVLLLRPLDPQRAAATLLDVKRMMRADGAAGNIAIAAGDVLVVPQNRISKVERIVRWVNVGLFLNPFSLSNP
jgi:polysaccharide export outer membrane protein